MNDDIEPMAPTDPWGQGSAACLAILPVLHRKPLGCEHEELMRVTGLSATEVSRALQGLKERGRVVPEGSKNARVWRAAHHVRAEAERLARQS